METEFGRDSFLEGLNCLIGLQKAYCEYITTTPLKCYYDQKLTSIFFSMYQKYSCQILTTSSFKSLCPREARLIEPRLLTSTGRDYKIYI